MAITATGPGTAGAGTGKAQTAGSGTTITQTWTPAAVGDLIIVSLLFGDNTNSPAVPTDTAGNVYHQISNSPLTDGTAPVTSMGVFWAFANGSSLLTVTGSGNALQAFSSIFIDGFRSVDSVPVDQVNKSATGLSGTTTSGGSVTPLFANELIWGFGADSITAVGAGFTKGGDDANGDWTEFDILVGGAGTPISATFTGSGHYDAFTVSFAASGSRGSAIRRAGRPFPYKPGSPPSQNSPFR